MLTREYESRKDALEQTVLIEHNIGRSIKLSGTSSQGKKMLSLECLDDICQWRCKFKMKRKQDLSMWCPDASNIYTHSLFCSSSTTCLKRTIINLTIDEQSKYLLNYQQMNQAQRALLVGIILNTTTIDILHH